MSLVYHILNDVCSGISNWVCLQFHICKISSISYVITAYQLISLFCSKFAHSWTYSLHYINWLSLLMVLKTPKRGLSSVRQVLLLIHVRTVMYHFDCVGDPGTLTLLCQVCKCRNFTSAQYIFIIIIIPTYYMSWLSHWPSHNTHTHPHTTLTLTLTQLSSNTDTACK